MNDNRNIKNELEAVLFALGREVSIKELSQNLRVETNIIEEEIEKLKEKYNETSGVVLVKINDAYQLITNKEYYEQVSSFVESSKRQNLSNSALETLTIIALIEEVARLNLPGRPAAYSVTSEFLKSCGIEKIEELPEFENIRIKDEQMLVSDYENKDENKEQE